jgi:hypothetical protein
MGKMVDRKLAKKSSAMSDSAKMAEEVIGEEKEKPAKRRMSKKEVAKVISASPGF